jgi:hypothetical protein
VEFYQPNRIGRWYGGVFLSLAQFPDSTANLSGNLVANLADGGMLATLALAWRPVQDFSVTGSLFGTFGPGRAEYTLAGKSLATELRLALAF